MSKFFSTEKKGESNFSLPRAVKLLIDPLIQLWPIDAFCHLKMNRKKVSCLLVFLEDWEISTATPQNPRKPLQCPQWYLSKLTSHNLKEERKKKQHNRSSRNKVEERTISNSHEWNITINSLGGAAGQAPPPFPPVCTSSRSPPSASAFVATAARSSPFCLPTYHLFTFWLSPAGSTPSSSFSANRVRSC